MHLLDQLTGRSTSKLIARMSIAPRLWRRERELLGPDTHVDVQPDETAVLVIDGRIAGTLASGEHVLGVLPFSRPLNSPREVSDRPGSLVGDVYFVPTGTLLSIELPKALSSFVSLATSVRWHVRGQVRLYVSDPSKLVANIAGDDCVSALNKIQHRTLQAVTGFLSRTNEGWKRRPHEQASEEARPELAKVLSEELADTGLRVEVVDLVATPQHLDLDPPELPSHASDRPLQSAPEEMRPAAASNGLAIGERSRREAIARLKELAELHKLGALTNEEFDAKRKSLLEQL